MYSRVAAVAIAVSLYSAALLICGAVAAHTAGGAERGPLDGAIFVIASYEKGRPAEAQEDRLVFADGKLSNVGGRELGFAPAPYAASRQGDTTTFSATLTSAEAGTVTWQGTVKGEVIDGTFLWQRPEQAPSAHVFRGKLERTPGGS